jgi:hypothetical protein
MRAKRTLPEITNILARWRLCTNISSGKVFWQRKNLPGKKKHGRAQRLYASLPSCAPPYWGSVLIHDWVQVAMLVSVPCPNVWKFKAIEAPPANCQLSRMRGKKERQRWRESAAYPCWLQPEHIKSCPINTRTGDGAWCLPASQMERCHPRGKEQEKVRGHLGQRTNWRVLALE